MPRLATIARRHWQEYLPTAYAKLPDPTAFFEDLETRVLVDIDDLTMQLRQDPELDQRDLPEESKLAMARRRAEEIVLPEEVFLPPEPMLEARRQEQADPAAAAVADAERTPAPPL